MYEKRFKKSVMWVVWMAACLWHLPGCDFYSERFGYDEWTYMDSWDPMWMGEPLDVSHGAIQGDYGRSRLSQATPAVAEGWRASSGWGVDTATVTVEASEENGWVSMALVDLYGALEGDVLAPGHTRTYHIEDDTLEPFVMVTGCTGFDPSSWEYDDVAETVTITVEPESVDNGARVVHFDATFVKDMWAAPGSVSNITTLSGSFTVMPLYPEP